ncbi:MAG: hybrid sensor histidine kinase/response regulator [Verrucomicrobiota bacterium]
MAALSSPALPVDPPKPVPSTQRRTLLIVDDEEGPRQALRIVFQEDYHILLAENGPRALALAHEHEIDVVVLDIRMAGMSGIEVLHHLKKHDPSIEVVMLTAFETLETARQALRLGACDYLTKPFDIEVMRAAVQTAMERRQISLQIRQYNHRLQELQQEINNHRLREEIARTRGEIYASIIHDINGPLTVISGFIDVINQRIGNAPLLEGENLEIIKDRLRRISRQVANCVEISRRYLSFLQGRSSEQSPVSVNQILRDLEELLKIHPTLQTNKLVIRPLSADASANINGTDLIQVLLNLTINALQSTPQSHRVEISGQRLNEPIPWAHNKRTAQELWIPVSGFQNHPPFVGLAIEDNGPGIPPELVGRIFEPYFTTKPTGQGTGLGLVIVKRLVEQAGGAIHLQTKMGEGTRFTVYLPIRTAPPSTSGPHKTAGS